MNSQSEQWLVSFDTDRIKDYIFATNNLKEIRGASAILVKIEDQRIGTLQINDADVIYSAGGGGAFFAQDKLNAEKLVQQIELDFRNKTGNAGITAIAACNNKTNSYKNGAYNK